MLHRVTNERSRITINRNIEVEPAFLERTIKEYKAKGYFFATMDDVEQIVSGKMKVKQKFVCFTFDDGYVDNFSVAYPIFKRYNCPFTIYITTDFPDYKAIVWWYVLDDLIMENSELRLGDGSHFICNTMEEKNETFKLIHKKISDLKPNLIEEKFNEWFVDYNYSFYDTVRKLSMSWEQILQLSDEGLCTIASHTVTHPYLTSITPEQQRMEMHSSKERLELELAKDVAHFAYPFGSHNKITANIVETVGYKTAVIAWGGVVRAGVNPFLLQRVFLKQE